MQWIGCGRGRAGAEGNIFFHAMSAAGSPLRYFHEAAKTAGWSVLAPVLRKTRLQITVVEEIAMGVHDRAIGLSLGEGSRVREYYSQEEIDQFLAEAFASPAITRIIASEARRRLRSYKLPNSDAEELMSEAYVRSCAGVRKRSYYRGRTLLECFVGVMHSISRDWVRVIARERKRTDWLDDEDIDKLSDAAPGTEREIIARQDYGLVVLEFDDDPIAQAVLEGWLQGLKKEELCRQLLLTETEYDSKLRKIRNRLNRRFPGNWDFG